MCRGGNHNRFHTLLHTLPLTETYVCTCIESGMITAPGAVSIDWLKVTCPRCDLIAMFARPFLPLSAWMPDRDGQLARPGTSFLVLLVTVFASW